MTSSKNNCLIETDTLTNLPEDLREKILTYLPIEEAWRTCILSSKWRYTWQSIPELYLHVGPICKFALYARKNSFKALGGWIVNLSRNGIRELTLHLNIDYMMHSRFFACEELNYINLAGCSFKVPLQFKGFKLLHTLKIRWATISDGDLEKLISSCPLLKNIRLNSLHEGIVINIHAPNLLTLEIDANFSNLEICAPKLRSLWVDVWSLNESFPSCDSVLCNLPELETIRLKGSFFLYLCDEHLREEFPSTFNCLKNLDIALQFGDQKQETFALALFQRAPHLQSLNIDACLSHLDALPNAKIWEKVDRREDLFKQLQTVKIDYFGAKDLFLSFIKFILASAPQLVTLTIEEDEFPEYEDLDVGSMFTQLLQFERASPNAKLLFK